MRQQDLQTNSKSVVHPTILSTPIWNKNTTSSNREDACDDPQNI